MIWTRKECKAWAKEALQRNYWRIVLVAFLAMLLFGGSPGSTNWVKMGLKQTDTASDDSSMSVTTEPSAEEASITTDRTQPPQDSSLVPEKVRMVGIVIFILILLVVFTFLFALQALLFNPFLVGCSRFMVKSVDDRAKVKEIAYGFDHSYKNIVKTMFHYDICIFLWSLLFIIPGFYKQYQYRMVPYILAETPDMDYKEVLQKSTDMMRGEKWKAFVLDLSFIPWHIFGMITCGIAEVFYVYPYHSLTLAALYRKLNWKNMQVQAQPEALMGENNDI